MILIHIAWILALAVILWPLFTIAKYDYPSADDWSFGKYMYRAMQAGEGIAGVFHAIYQTLAQNVWEARFSILILSALQPAAFGEHFYRITPYLMIGSVILSQFLLLRECIAGQAKENRWLILPIGIPMAILQVLYCPYPEESFYWYNGSVNYTFVYSLSLVLLTLFNLIVDPSFFKITLGYNSAGDPVLSGYLIIILVDGSHDIELDQACSLHGKIIDGAL